MKTASPAVSLRSKGFALPGVRYGAVTNRALGEMALSRRSGVGNPAVPHQDSRLKLGRRRNEGKAFTLFEVLMAMGIFALVVIGALAALNAALTAAREARIEQLARIQIENRLALLEGGPIQEIERVVETETPKMTFTETVKRENVVGKNQTILNGFWRVRVVAKWKADNEERSLEASFLRFGQ